MARPLKIAIVDDEEVVRTALKRLIASTRNTALTYLSGSDFLVDGLAENRPDCLVLDLQLGEVSGLEVLQRLRALRASIPAIIITAHDEPGSREECFAAGASAYMQKPLDDQALLDAIAAATSRKL
jgi:FixJ family two-component response regulator